MATNITKKVAPDAVDSTTKGDILVNTGSDILALPVGLDGQTLVVDPIEATGLKWITLSIQAQEFAADENSNFLLDQTFNNKIIPINTNSNNVTVTLDTVIPQGFQVILFNYGIGTVIINPAGQTLRARGLEIQNINAAATLSYDAANLTWYGIGDLI